MPQRLSIIWSALCPTLKRPAATRICSRANPIQKEPAQKEGAGRGVGGQHGTAKKSQQEEASSTHGSEDRGCTDHTR